MPSEKLRNDNTIFTGRIRQNNVVLFSEFISMAKYYFDVPGIKKGNQKHIHIVCSRNIFPVVQYFGALHLISRRNYLQ